MSRKEELEEMGIEVKECKECLKEILKSEYDENKGYCKICYDNMNTEEQTNSENNISLKFILITIYKVIAVVGFFVGIIRSIAMSNSYYTEEYAVLLFWISLISCPFLYLIILFIESVFNIEKYILNEKRKDN